MRITIEHMRAMRYCAAGLRQFFERHNLDWRKFVREGIDESELIATGDAMAKAVVDYAKGLNDG